MVLDDDIKRRLVEMKNLGYNKKETSDALGISFPTCDKYWNYNPNAKNISKKGGKYPIHDKQLEIIHAVLALGARKDLNDTNLFYDVVPLQYQIEVLNLNKMGLGINGIYNKLHL